MCPSRSAAAPQLTCGAGIYHPGLGQLALQVQHGLAHLGGAGILGFVALVKHNLRYTGLRNVPEAQKVSLIKYPTIEQQELGRCKGIWSLRTTQYCLKGCRWGWGHPGGAWLRLDYREGLSRPKAKVPRRARQQENCTEAPATAVQILWASTPITPGFLGTPWVASGTCHGHRLLWVLWAAHI